NVRMRLTADEVTLADRRLEGCRSGRVSEDSPGSERLKHHGYGHSLRGGKEAIRFTPLDSVDEDGFSGQSFRGVHDLRGCAVRGSAEVGGTLCLGAAFPRIEQDWIHEESAS